MEEEDQPRASTECQFCGSADLDHERYRLRWGPGHAWCRACHRMSVPVSRALCWSAMTFVRRLGALPDLVDAFADAEDRLRVDRSATVGSLPEHELLATRALKRSGNNAAAAIAELHRWAEAVPGDQQMNKK